MGQGVRRLILWDIDGTLVRAGDLGAAVFDDALERVLGRRPPERVRMSGKTDPQIVGEYLLMMDVELAHHERHLPLVLGHVETELALAADRLAAEGRALPGVVEVLQSLGRRPDVVQSVLTGNIAPNALVKLKAFGLDQWLDLEVGAYGSDHADRLELVPIALARVAERRGQRIDPGAVWVVGDTVRDLACARAGGTRCLLVATGRSTEAELATLGADAVLADLSDVDRVCALLTDDL